MEPAGLVGARAIVSRIYWDTMLFVYLLERHREYLDPVLRIRAAIRARGDVLCTSVLTVGELLAGAFRRRDAELEHTIRRVMRPPAVQIIPFDEAAVERFAQIRAVENVASADAVHLACAAEAGTDVFLTNDKALRGKMIEGIQFITGIDTDLFSTPPP